MAFREDQLWDAGPEPPVEPNPPALSASAGENGVSVEARTRLALEYYSAAYEVYLAKKAEFDAFGSRPKLVQVGNAREALDRDAASVAAGRQAKPRYSPVADLRMRR